jgi:hypothetical protein
MGHSEPFPPADSLDVRVLAVVQFVLTVAANATLWDARIAWFYAIETALTPVAILLSRRLRPAPGI